MVGTARHQMRFIREALELQRQESLLNEWYHGLNPSEWYHGLNPSEWHHGLKHKPDFLSVQLIRLKSFVLRTDSANKDLAVASPIFPCLLSPDVILCG